MAPKDPPSDEQPQTEAGPLESSLAGVIELCGRLLDCDRHEQRLDLLVEGAIEILRVDSGYLVRPVDDRLAFFRQWGKPSGASEPVSRAIVREALEAPRAILIENASLDARFALRESVRSGALRSVLASRINTHDPLALYLETSRRQLGGEHLKLFQTIVDLAGSVLRRSAESLQREHSQELFERYDFHGIVARDPLTQQALELVAKIARADYPVLIEGPSGAGKELIARAIHRNSRRREGPLVTINCGAISPSLLEAELFGRTAGAYTGAEAPSEGLIRSANGGTLLLDEIGDLPKEMQVKLLRTLQFGEIQPVGSSKPLTTDVRFLASTNRTLEDEVRAGRFRDDLYQRLNTLRVEVPALSERPRDIEPLFRHFLDAAARDLETTAPPLADGVEAALLAHDWPGNVRELENEAKRLIVLHGYQPIDPAHLSFASGPADSRNELATLEEAERELIQRHLKITGGNRSAAARALGISREGLRKKMIRLGLSD